MLKRDWLPDAAAIGLGAFLMFLVQPLVGKIVTPQYGGAAQVWSACLMFFQLTLLAGYGFTFLASRLPLKMQAVLYIILLLISAVLVDIPLGGDWIPPPEADPLPHLLKNLFLFVSLPCILLSTVSTLLQNWYGIVRKQSPYYLYSISNIGSMLALLAYPILVEPTLSIGRTLEYWTWGYRLLSVLIILCALRVFKWDGSAKQGTDASKDMAPLGTSIFWWLGLSACGTVLLISMTHHLSNSIAPVPMLWIPPLVVYLLTFILAFGNDNFYNRKIFLPCGQLALALLIYATLNRLAPIMSIALHLAALFFLCMICHGEIYRRRPHPDRLPAFYFAIAAGGALGGILINLVAPVMFQSYLEYPLILMTMGLIAVYIAWREQALPFRNSWLVRVWILGAIAVSIAAFDTHQNQFGDKLVLARRNFYGTAFVLLETNVKMLTLTNGTTLHGGMVIDLDSKRFDYTPTTYYVENSAIGITHRYLRERRGKKPLKIGVIGLGVGTVAAYGKPGDEITFFEIDPKIRDIALQNFRFLSDSKAKTDVVLGDGRLSLARLEPQAYDMLVVDAFSSDAIPVHLVTREALEVYRRHLKPDGLLLFHVSNNFLSLEKVIGNLAHNAGLNGVYINTPRLRNRDTVSSYSILTRHPWFIEKLQQPEFRKSYPKVNAASLPQYPNVGVWRDDYSNLFSILR